MAQSKNNIITHGLSGKVGDILVFSQRNGKTIVSKVPKRTAQDSEKQKQHKQKFQEAVLYAKNAMQNPAIKQQYQEVADKKEGLSAYNIAVADLFNAPNIEEINFSAYTGKRGEIIKIKVYDDFKVASVSVHIYNADGSLVEEGNATYQGLEWHYATTKNNEDLSGDKIIIRATDTATNLSEKETIL